MHASTVILGLRRIERFISADNPNAAISAARRLIIDIDRDEKVEAIQHFAQVCATEHAPKDLAQALRELADTFEPF